MGISSCHCWRPHLPFNDQVRVEDRCPIHGKHMGVSNSDPAQNAEYQKDWEEERDYGWAK